jgi:hypothetical protein
MHDKHGPLVSIGKHLGMFVDQVQVRARYAISDEPMSAEEWKKQYVKGLMSDVYSRGLRGRSPTQPLS